MHKHVHIWHKHRHHVCVYVCVYVYVCVCVCVCVCVDVDVDVYVFVYLQWTHVCNHELSDASVVTGEVKAVATGGHHGTGTHSLTHTLSHSHTHSRTHTLTHPLTHSLTQWGYEIINYVLVRSHHSHKQINDIYLYVYPDVYMYIPWMNIITQKCFENICVTNIWVYSGAIQNF